MCLNNKLLSSILISFLIISSCNNNNNQNLVKQKVIIKDTIPDKLPAHLQKKADKIDAFFKNKFNHKVFNGNILFAENDKVLIKKCYGYSHLRKKTPLHLNSIFQLASVSKPLTATAILLLYDRGELDLEDDIKKYFPDFPYENITIHLLLTHRGGLTNYMYFSDKHWPDWEIPITNEDVIELMTEHEPKTYYRPNRRYNYSNTGFMLLASIVEKVTGMTFQEFMRKEVFQVLEMEHSFVRAESTELSKENVVIGYNKFRKPDETSYLDGVVGDKVVFISVEDLYLFDKAISNENFLAKETLEKAFTPRHRDLHRDDNYGYGWRINTISKKENKKIVWHTGWWKGFRSYFIKVLHKDQTIIILDNTTRGSFLRVKELIGLLE
ncbi:MAG: beta-lactamase family protein [Bacteroidia bacterium]|nr:beta-lactamase family protein [Bacteroidia bacterium]